MLKKELLLHNNKKEEPKLIITCDTSLGGSISIEIITHDLGNGSYLGEQKTITDSDIPYEVPIKLLAENDVGLSNLGHSDPEYTTYNVKYDTTLTSQRLYETNLIQTGMDRHGSMSGCWLVEDKTKDAALHIGPRN